MLGKRSAYPGRNPAKTLSIVCGGAATLSTPESSRLSSSMRSPSIPSWPSTPRQSLSSCSPRVVRKRRRSIRSKSLNPHSYSRSLICLDKADWLMRGQVSAGYSEAHCDGTYLVERDSTVSMDYVCSVPANGGQVQFDVHARGVLTPHILQVAIPPAANGKARITPMYFASSFGRSLIGCAIVGENTTVVLDRSLVPVRGRDN